MEFLFVAGLFVNIWYCYSPLGTIFDEVKVFYDLWPSPQNDVTVAIVWNTQFSAAADADLDSIERSDFEPQLTFVKIELLAIRSYRLLCRMSDRTM